MLNFGASKPRVKGGPGPQGPPGSAPGRNPGFPRQAGGWGGGGRRYKLLVTRRVTLKSLKPVFPLKILKHFSHDMQKIILCKN